jgi:hypothetical protein
MATGSRFLFAWRFALSSEFGPKSSTDRHVALVLGLYMRTDGGGAWPSQATLAARTGISARWVRPALQRLVKQGWLHRITRKPRRGRGFKGTGFNYQARLPKRLSAMYWSGNEDATSLFKGRDAFKKRSRGNGDATSARPRTLRPPNTEVKHSLLPIGQALSLKTEEEDIAAMRAAFGET